MNNTNYIISKQCVITNNKLFINNKLIDNYSEINFNEILKELYHEHIKNYPKYFKMDNLSKLGIIAAELLSDEFKNTNRKNISIVLMNSASSLDTDNNFQKTIMPDNYFPSPSLFVYTLPNIVVGEICIKHKIFGETAFFISEHFDEKLMYNVIENMLNNEIAEKILTGWIDVFENNYYVNLFVVKKRNELLDNQNELVNFTTENLKLLFNKYCNI